MALFGLKKQREPVRTYTEGVQGPDGEWVEFTADTAEDAKAMADEYLAYLNGPDEL